MYDIGCMITRLTLTLTPHASPTPPQWNLQLGLAPPGKIVSVKNAVTLYYYAKDYCFLFMLTQRLIISILPCKDLS